MSGRRYFLICCRLTSMLGLFWTSLDFPVANADCGTPPDIDGASHNLTDSPPHPINTQIQYNCDIGYTESGLSRMYLCNGTHWVGDGYRCREILCSFIDPPENGIFTNNPTYTIGSRIEFGCLEGYDLEGPSYRRCRIDGWTSSSPVCRVKMCGQFVGVEHADLFQESPDGIENDYGSAITVTCHQNYILSGSYRVVCGADGQWSTPPTCDPSECPPYPVSASRCTATVSAEGVLYFLFCVDESENVSVTQVGGSVAVCMNNEWSDTSMACYCNCKIQVDTDRVIVHNVDGNNFLGHGQVLEWSCRQGSKMSELEFECNDGNIEQPDCILPPTATTTTTTTTTTTPTTASITYMSISTSSKTTITQVNATAAQNLSTQTSLIEANGTTQSTQVSTNVNVCSCVCSLQVDQGLLSLFQIDKTVNAEYNAICSEYTDGDESPRQISLFCDFDEHGTTLCKQSGRRYSSNAMAVWDSASTRLSETTKSKMNKVCGCGKASGSPVNNATPVYNINILNICIMIFTMVWSNKLNLLLLIVYVNGF